MKLPAAVPAFPKEKKDRWWLTISKALKPYFRKGGIVDGGHRLILGKIVEFPQRCIAKVDKGPNPSLPNASKCLVRRSLRPLKPSQKMFGSSNTYSPGIWNTTVTQLNETTNTSLLNCWWDMLGQGCSERGPQNLPEMMGPVCPIYMCAPPICLKWWLSLDTKTKYQKYPNLITN